MFKFQSLYIWRTLGQNISVGKNGKHFLTYLVKKGKNISIDRETVKKHQL